MTVRTKEKVVPVQAFVHSQFLKLEEGGEKAEGPPREKSEIIAVSKFVTEPARVQVDYGITINLGNFESARIGVAVSVPCYFEELDAAYKWAAKWAESRVLKEQEEIRKTLRDSTEDDF